MLLEQRIGGYSEKGNKMIWEWTSSRLVGLRVDQVGVPGGDKRVDVIVMVERRSAIGTAVLVDSVDGEVSVASFHLIEHALDVAEEPVGVLLASCDPEVVNAPGQHANWL
eukprot:3797875-Pyramimonas_sp.AAC.1